MQEAFKVVSSPRWQTQNTEDKPNTADTANTLPASDSDTATTSTLTADTAEATKADAAIADDTASTADSDDARDAELADDTATRTDVDDPEASAATTPRAYEPPTVMQTAKSPLLAITAACASVAALWSYTTLEDTRAQLANVTSAKATLERSLSEAQSKLTAAEKTVADVKAAIGAATAAPAKATGTTATK